jgi:hypothetical protein
MRAGSVASVFFFAILVLAGCRKEKTPEELAKMYCGSCHSFPDPALLDKTTWTKGVMPQMAFRMGMDYSNLIEVPEDDRPEVMKILPRESMISERNWKAIQEYYLGHAPDSLTLPQKPALPELTLFKSRKSTVALSNAPLITLVRFDSLHRKLYVGNRAGRFYTVDPLRMKAEDSLSLQSPPSDVMFTSGSEVLTLCMGIMDPNDRPAGKLRTVDLKNATAKELIDSLKRPVHFTFADLNGDGANDCIISTFGNYTGALLAFEQKNETFVRHVVHSLPGTRKTIVRDFNNDGLPDILALITQGDEQITLFENQGQFRFSPKILLRFPPVYGSSYFELADFNRDGLWDILYTNGDNADYSTIFKPYHGVRIFLQEKDNTFTQSLFHSMYGASQALARDFDNDGDLDIAAISFFPDFKKHPEQGFTYLQNDNGIFKPYSIPAGAAGRWITIEAADIDHDSDIDLLLGALDFPAGVPEAIRQQWQNERTTVLVLENQGSKANATSSSVSVARKE